MQVIIENNKLICPYCEKEFVGYNTVEYDSIIYRGQKGLKFIKRCASCRKKVDLYRFGLTVYTDGVCKTVEEDEVKVIK